MANIRGTNGRDDLYSGGNADHLFGGAGDDSLYGNGGADTLEGGTDDDILYGGGGGDTFLYTLGEGNDTIADYEEDDKIQIKSGSIKINTKGNDYILTVSSGSRKGTITVQDAFKDKKIITYVDANGDEHRYPEKVIIDGTKATVTALYDDDSFNIADYGNDGKVVKTIDASQVIHDLKIIANGNANRIIATEEDDYIDGGSGKDTIIGGDGNDTVYGGKGNDSLVGGSGDDVFVYNNGDGNDVITDYQMGDVIKITSGSVKSANLNGNDYVFTIGSGKITVKNAKDKYIAVEDANGSITYYPESPIPSLQYEDGTVTLKKRYIGDAFNVADFESGFAGKVYRVDASEVTHGLSITANKESNSITGTEEDDYIDGAAGKDTILGGDGNDTVYGGKGNDSLVGGDGDDVFVYKNGDGNDVITDYQSGDIIKITEGNASVTKKGSDYIIAVGKGKITVKNAGNKYIAVADANDKITWYPSDPTPALTYSNVDGVGTVTIKKAYKQTYFAADDFSSDFAGDVDNINASAVTHSMNIVGNGESNEIVGTKQKDTINGGDGSDTIIGGKGDDILSGGDDADVFVYKKDDGNDKILDYDTEDLLSFSGVTVKNHVNKGDNAIFTLADKSKITVVGGANKVVRYTEDDGNTIQVHNDKEVVDFSKNGKSATLLENYYDSEFNVTAYDSNYASKVVTVDASAVQHDLAITANKNANRIIGTEEDDYIDGAAGKDTILGGDGNDTIYGGKGNDSLSGGDGDDVFVYNNGDGNDVITDYQMGDVIKVAKGTANVSKDGSDYIIAVGKGEITVKGAGNSYLAVADANDNITWYPDDPTEALSYTRNSGVLTIKKKYKYNDFDVNVFESDFAGKVYTIDASAVTHSMNIIGNQESNSIIGTKQKDTIDGGDGDDTITGGKGNDVLTGGDGADVFVYKKGDGNDKILDYDEEDTINITGVAVKNVAKAKNGKDVLFTLADKSKITVVGGADKIISYAENGVISTYPGILEPVEFSKDGKGATVLSAYGDDSFNVNTYDSNYASTVVTIDASAVDHALTITGNKKANRIIGTGQDDYIYGGAGADTIYGGAGNDVLSGNAGADVFAYSKGDGNDKILDYDEEDTIDIKGVQVKSVTTSKNNQDVIFTLADKKKITVAGGADKFISYKVNGEEYVYPDTPVRYNNDYTAATISAGYSKDSFTSADYKAYVDTLATVNASAVQHGMTIGGSGLANYILATDEDDYIDGGAGKDTIYGNDGDDTVLGGSGNDKIYGGDGNDSLWGGAGNDTLFGGEGDDIFVYKANDGKDVIGDFQKGDKLMILAEIVRDPRVVNNGADVRFETAGSGSITVKDGADKLIQVVDSYGNVSSRYTYNPLEY